MEQYGKNRQATEHNSKIRRMRTTCWVTTATDTHSDFPLQQRLHEHTSMLRYMYCTLPVLLTPFLSAPRPLRFVSWKKPRLLGEQETKWSQQPIGTFYGRGEPLVHIDKTRTGIRKDFFQHNISNTCNLIYFRSTIFIFGGIWKGRAGVRSGVRAIGCISVPL